MSLGNTLRAAREACGFSTSELAARTHMLVQIVDGLENEDFRRIPAPIYGRGFIKLYCEAVNLDPKPLQAEFMELFDRSKNRTHNNESPRRHSVPSMTPSGQQPTADETSASNNEESATTTRDDIPAEDVKETIPAQPTEEPQTETNATPQPSMADLGELFAQPAAQAPQPQTRSSQFTPIQRPAVQQKSPRVVPPPKRSYGDIFGEAYSAEPERPKTSAADRFRSTMSNVSSGVFSNVQKLPSNIGRIIAVSLCALLTIALAGWGIFVLYKATSPVAGESTDITNISSTEKSPEIEPAAINSSKVTGKTPEQKNSVKKSVAATARQSTQAVRSNKPGDLKSSNIEIPALYID